MDVCGLLAFTDHHFKGNLKNLTINDMVLTQVTTLVVCPLCVEHKTCFQINFLNAYYVILREKAG